MILILYFSSNTAYVFLMLISCSSTRSSKDVLYSWYIRSPPTAFLANCHFCAYSPWNTALLKHIAPFIRYWFFSRVNPTYPQTREFERNSNHVNFPQFPQETQVKSSQYINEVLRLLTCWHTKRVFTEALDFWRGFVIFLFFASVLFPCNIWAPCNKYRRTKTII